MFSKGTPVRVGQLKNFLACFTTLGSLTSKTQPLWIGGEEDSLRSCFFLDLERRRLDLIFFRYFLKILRRGLGTEMSFLSSVCLARIEGDEAAITVADVVEGVTDLD